MNVSTVGEPRLLRHAPRRDILTRTHRSGIEVPSVSNYCEHCQGQRFDRARVLRALRSLYRDGARNPSARAALASAMRAVRNLDIPHLEWDDEEGEIVH
jgi:hypothetical protein